MNGKRKKTPFRVVAAYDTETCNVGSGNTTRAYPILYILNNFKDVPLNEYQPDDIREHITFDRTEDEFIQRIVIIIQDGIENKYVPIICAYNLMFDMTTIMTAFSQSFYVKVNAQSSTNVYTIDIYANEQDAENKVAPLLRFWDTFFLEQNGLRAMGETAGLPKAVGDWDYSLIRTPETPLTERELFYAKRDVQVIPAYLRYLLRSNEWMTADMLGVNVLTKTSTVRQMAKHTFGNIRVGNNGSKRAVTMLKKFEYLCKQELPVDYDSYALRKACFRGGFTFTASNTACQDMPNVVSTDVTSMHHTFINGRLIPVCFKRMSKQSLQVMAETVLETTVETVLSRYYKPFGSAFHIRVRFDNIRLRKNSVFEQCGIALTPRGKFAQHAVGVDYWSDDPAAVAAENGVRSNGWRDDADKPLFAFGKLYSAEHALLHVNEIELWCLGQVYEWDTMTVLCGEGTIKFTFPPDYVTLQSNMLFERKTDCKLMTKQYEGIGHPFNMTIPASIPEGIASELRAGTLDPVFLNNYYNGTVKGQFNSIYGTMAQDIFKPGYEVEDTGEINIDYDTVATRANYESKIPEHPRVLYTYGMRIVAGSRMHLVIAMMLVWETFKGRVIPTGGDTDSIKMSVPDDITDDQISDSLRPLLEAATNAIDYTMRPLREQYPQWASQLTHVGGFEVENAGDRYPHHMEYWNKARVSMDMRGKFHVTMAGLSRPIGAYHIEHIMADMYKAGYSFNQIASNMLGYNVTVASEACFSMQTYRPLAGDMYDNTVTDYMGNTMHVCVHEAVALYEADRTLGDTSKLVNMENIRWLRAHNRQVNIAPRTVCVENMTPLLIGGVDGDTILMKGVQHERK